ncbi:MAG: hypothetical protein WEH44_04465, partial [Pirellulaceae bacterium]
GWYKRQREQGTQSSQPAADAGPIVRGQQPEASAPTFPPPEHQGSTLVPLKRRPRTQPATRSDSLAARQVLLEWKRPTDQPWDGVPVAEVALRSEPRAGQESSLPAVEFFDAPLATGGTLWR